MEKITPTQIAMDLLVVGTLLTTIKLPPYAIDKLKQVIDKSKTCLTEEELAIDVSPKQVLDYLFNKYEIE